jgi:pseudaminic acid synthase
VKIIADIGASHGGSFKNARRLIEYAWAAGADAAKLQLYDPHKLAASRRAKLGDPITWNGKDTSLLDLYQAAHTPRDWFERFFWFGEQLGIEVFASVFDREGIDYLETLDCPAYKISSYEGNDKALIAHARATGKPVIVSNPSGPLWADIAVLHCVSKYPCPDDEAEVNRITELKSIQPIVGFSDHTLGTAAALKAKELGAVIFEKHIKLEGDTTSPDSGFAIEPAAFTAYVAALK